MTQFSGHGRELTYKNLLSGLKAIPIICPSKSINYGRINHWIRLDLQLIKLFNLPYQYHQNDRQLCLRSTSLVVHVEHWDYENDFEDVLHQE